MSLVPCAAQLPTRDIPYAGTSNPRQTLDLYRPQNITADLPVVVFIHGGAWRGGSKDEAARLAETLTLAGYAVAAPNYRLSSEAVFPAQIQDVRAAIRFLRANAAQYRLDPNRFVAIGTSAGAHLAALVATASDVAAWDVGPNPGVSTRVQAAIAMYAPTSFLAMDADLPGDVCREAAPHNAPNSPESQLLGCPIETCTDKVAQASPLTYVSADDPPLLLLHGSNDCTVAAKQSVRLYDAIRQRNGRVTLRILPGASHGGAPFSTPQITRLMLNFLLESFGTGSQAASAADGQTTAVAPGQMVSFFANARIASDSETARSLPLPKSMQGVTVTVEANGSSTQADLLFVSPNQVNFIMPASSGGPATVRVQGLTSLTDTIRVDLVAPGLFHARNAHDWAVGQNTYMTWYGWPDGHPLTVRYPDGRIEPFEIPYHKKGNGSFVLSLFGTGKAGGSEVVAYIDGYRMQVLYAGPAPGFVGLDQYNVAIPEFFPLKADHVISLMVDGVPANPVTVRAEP